MEFHKVEELCATGYVSCCFHDPWQKNYDENLESWSLLNSIVSNLMFVEGVRINDSFCVLMSENRHNL